MNKYASIGTKKEFEMNLFNLIKGEVNQKELLNYYNATIIYEELPKKINGYVFNYDGVNFIIVNKNLSYYKKKKTIIHELAHLELSQLNQIDKDLAYLKVDKYEDEADKYIKMLLELVKEWTLSLSKI